MTEFLTIKEAAILLKLTPKAIQNKMSKGILKRGVHYWKREKEIGVRFDRAALEKWVREGDGQDRDAIPMANGGMMR